MHRFQDLLIWKKSMSLAESVYKFSSNFPEVEKFGLTSQIRRCAISIPSNISEGAGRNGRKEFNYFLGISLGSLAELETQTLLAERFHYITKEVSLTTSDNIQEIRRMIFAFQNKL